jgi:hypothetical protein
MFQNYRNLELLKEAEKIVNSIHTSPDKSVTIKDNSVEQAVFKELLIRYQDEIKDSNFR